jgi:sterol desaturase/sphingolipid hydroxylase (fatty acid hydroxylase superfamily)
MARTVAPTKWAFTPALPLRTAPIARRPLDPAALGRHLLSVWHPLSSRMVILAASFVAWIWFSPTVAEAATISPGWVAEILIRNYVVVLGSAGLTHLWLYTWRRQGDELRYDARPLGRNKRIFLFGDQVKDNMFLTLVFAVPIGTAWEVVMWWSYGNGFNLSSSLFGLDGPLTWSGGWGQRLWFVALLLIVPVYSNNHFGVVHWLLHRGPLYRHIHAVHHKNVNVGPWSGLAMHPAEHVALFADVWLFLLVPSNPSHMLFAVMHHHVGAPLSHTGYDGIHLTAPGRSADGTGRRGRPLTLAVGDFHHQLHHRFIECNYGGLESPLDDLLGAFHDGSSDGDRRIAERRRRLAARHRHGTAPVGRTS